MNSVKVITFKTLLWLVLFSSTVYGQAGKLVATDSQISTTLAVLEQLEANHYQSVAINDTFSSEFLENYLDTLDPAKQYFLKADIDSFAKYDAQLDDLVKQGNITPAFEIFNRYRERVTERINHNIVLLQEPNPFDFTIDESLDIDSDDNQWLESREQLDDIWRKRVKDSYLRLLLADKPEEEIPALLIKRYKNQLKRVDDMDEEDVFTLYLNVLTSLYDPHTNYYSPRQLEDFNISMSLSLEGIGAMLQTEDENTKIVRIIPGGPADQQGILAPQDVIVGVGQGDDDIEDVVGWRLEDVVDLIRGKKGTTVKLEIIPAKGESAGINKVIAIVRDEVKLEEQAAKGHVLDLDLDGNPYKIGVIDLPAFYLDFEAYQNREDDYKSTTRDVYKLLQDFRDQDVDGVIIDLRNNGGGSLHEATTLTDLFVNPGPVVQIRHSNNLISRQYRSRSAPFYNGPLLVLINRLSASASEIFAGAVQDYGRGLVVGTQSFGKGTVQTLLPLPEGQLKVTESKFYRVSGDSTQHRGVVPDITLPSLYRTEDIGESSQDHALPWDRIHPIPIKKSTDVQSLVPDLMARYDSRAANDPDFLFLLDELNYRDRFLDRKELSLNLETRKNERSEGETTIFEFENKRRLAKGEAPYPDVAAWKAANPDESDENEEALQEDKDDNVIDLAQDPLLKQAGLILSDQIQQMKGPRAHLATARE